MKILLAQKMSGIGGSEIYLTHLLPNLRKNGIDATLAIFYNEPDKNFVTGYCTKMEAAGIPVKLFPVSSIPSLAELRQIAKYIRQENFDLVHSHLLVTDIIVTLIKRLFLRKMVIVSTKHGYNETYFNQFGTKVNYKLVDPYRILATWAERKINLSFAVSNALKELFVGLKIARPGKMLVVYHGFDYPEISKQSGEEYNNNTKIVLIGRLVELKGHEFAIRAMQIVLASVPGAKLIIAGTGPMEGKLKALVEELKLHQSVVFLGFHNAPRDLMAQGRLVLIPSVAEAFGLTLLEAMSCYMPIVAFDVPAPNEIVEHEVQGLLAKPFEVVDLAQQLIKLLNDTELCVQMGEKGYETQTQFYNLGRMTAQTIDIYKMVLKQ